MHGPNEKLGLRTGQSQRHNQKMSNLHFDLSLKLSQKEVHDFSGEVQKFSGEVQNDLRGGAHFLTDFTTSRAFFVSARDHI
jgi:hypothetical protein